MPTKALIFEAIDTAVAKHFGSLFEVLMVDPSEAGVQRFKKGLSRLTATEKTVREVVRHMEETT